MKWEFAQMLPPFFPPHLGLLTQFGLEQAATPASAGLSVGRLGAAVQIRTPNPTGL